MPYIFVLLSALTVVLKNYLDARVVVILMLFTNIYPGSNGSDGSTWTAWKRWRRRKFMVQLVSTLFNKTFCSFVQKLLYFIAQTS